MRKILVSGCLYGEICRYDAKCCPCTNDLFLKWKKENQMVVVCPEVLGGLKTPRPASERQGSFLDSKVTACTGKDCTKEYLKGALIALEKAKEFNVVCCILKERSPSCGSNMVYDGTFSGKKICGQGVTTQILRDNGFVVFSEEEIDKAEKYISEHE